MNDSGHTQPPWQEVPQEEKPEAPRTIAKPKRTPRESKNTIIVDSVNPTESLDGKSTNAANATNIRRRKTNHHSSQ